MDRVKRQWIDRESFKVLGEKSRPFRSGVLHHSGRKRPSGSTERLANARRPAANAGRHVINCHWMTDQDRRPAGRGVIRIIGPTIRWSFEKTFIHGFHADRVMLGLGVLSYSSKQALKRNTLLIFTASK
jgi:hypothetical protein